MVDSLLSDKEQLSIMELSLYDMDRSEDNLQIL